MTHVVFFLWLVPAIGALVVLFVGMWTGMHEDSAALVSWTCRNLLPLLGVLLSSYFLPSENPWPRDQWRRRFAGALMLLLCFAYYSLIAYHFNRLVEVGQSFVETGTVLEPWIIGMQCIAFAAFGPFFGLRKQDRA
jgi:hypothetical protein